MKYIYLDQNKWIEMARGLKENNKTYIDFYRITKEKVKKKECVFPLSLIHIIETTKRKDIISRNNVLDLMLDLSDGYSICDYANASQIEFNIWIKTNNVDCCSLRKTIIRKDWGNLVALPTDDILSYVYGSYLTKEELRIISKQHKLDDYFFKLICDSIVQQPNDEQLYYDDYQKGRLNFVQNKLKLIDKKGITKEKFYRQYLSRAFSDEYEALYKIIDIEHSPMIENILQNPTKEQSKILLETLPGFNVQTKLMYELYNNADKDIHKHDFYDIAFLRVAVPYCDILVGEKYWCNRIVTNKLNKKYNTEVITDILKLKDIL